MLLEPLKKKKEVNGDMTSKRFIAPREKDEEFCWSIIDTENDKVVLQHISRFAIIEMCFLLNELDYHCALLLEQKEQWKDAYKQLEQQNLNLIHAIIKTCDDLEKEGIYLGDFDICKRITEYEKELSGV